MNETQVQLIEDSVCLAEVPEECPYLRDRVATMRFGDGTVLAPLYRQLMDRGYRRSGTLIYRPACRTCRECRVIRVPVAGFRRSKEQRRIWNRGAGIFNPVLLRPGFNEYKLALYQRYLAHQHGEADPEFDEDRYRAFLVDSCLGMQTLELQFWYESRLVGAGIVDRFEDALSSVYFFFDPDFARYSPGTYSALYEIELARKWDLEYYYLGHYIEHCPSMSYKARFRPCEIRTANGCGWEVLQR